MQTLVFLLDSADLERLAQHDAVRVRLADAPDVARAIDTVVALAVETPAGPVFCGLATLGGLVGPGLEPGELAGQLRRVRLYPNGEPCADIVPGRRIGWALRAFGEDEQAGFVTEPPTPHQLIDISRLALRRYHERCAISDMAMPVGEIGSLPTAIRVGHGGEFLSVTNFIALWGPLGSAFGAGHFTVSSNYELIVNMDRLDQRLHRHLQPGLKLRLPDQEEDWPSPDHLAWHRNFVFRG